MSQAPTVSTRQRFHICGHSDVIPTAAIWERQLGKGSVMEFSSKPIDYWLSQGCKSWPFLNNFGYQSVSSFLAVKCGQSTTNIYICLLYIYVYYIYIYICLLYIYTHQNRTDGQTTIRTLLAIWDTCIASVGKKICSDCRLGMSWVFNLSCVQRPKDRGESSSMDFYMKSSLM